MPYKVFLVEDEIVTREGIRDNVDWKSAGFEFCGEAPDGEIALPLIESTQPDVLITDIKMPFMDGLQLCKIVREHMPWIKIIILSGYDDFNYAQAAVKLGVNEYLLKPVSVQDLQAVLSRVCSLLDQEHSERENLKQLRSQVEDNLALLREKYLLRLVLGGESTVAAIEQSQQLGLEIIARYYLVILVKLELKEHARPFDYKEYQKAERVVANLAGSNPGVLLTRKDMEELVIILKGDSPDQLDEEAAFLAGLVKQEVEEKTALEALIGIGTRQQRLGDLHRSFLDATLILQGAWEGSELKELHKLDPSALREYLERGEETAFEAFFEAKIRPVAETGLRSYLLKHYLLMDIVLSTAQFISDLGGDIDHILPQIFKIDQLVASSKDMDQLKGEVWEILSAALSYRGSQGSDNRQTLIQQARAYIEGQFADPNLSLNQVAAQVSFSPSYFSAVFSRETGEPFRDYLTRMRIDHAKKLLRTTRLKCAEVAFQSGYNDAHYFSQIFKKNTGLTPQQFRDWPRNKK